MTIINHSNKLVLSSSSPARRLLLQRLQLPFTSTSPNVDETALTDESIPAMVVRLAEAKARKAAVSFPQGLIIGCDQVGELNNMMLTKPLTYAKACEQLRAMSNQCVRFYNGLCLFDAEKNELQSTVEYYDVHFRELTDSEIECYLKKEEPYQCAGSFQVEGLGISLIRKLEGEDYTALIGLPLIRLTGMLEKAGMGVL